MDIKNIIKGIDTVIEGLTLIKTNLPSAMVNKLEREPVVNTEVESPVEKEEPKVVNTGDYSREDLESMSYKDLQQLAVDIGVKANGKKAEILERILNGEVETEETNEQPEDEVRDKVGEVEKKVVSKTEEDIAPKEEEIVEKPNCYTKVEKALADYELKDLADILESIEVSTKGNRQALLDRIVTAVEEGLLEFEDDEDEQVEGEVQEEVEDRVEPVKEEEEENAESEDTVARTEGMKEVARNVRAGYKSGDITDKDIKDFLAKVLTQEDNYVEIMKSPKDDLVEYFIEINQALVDDEGELHDIGDPYYVGDAVMCCGREIQVLDNKNLYCEACGTEYQTEA